MSASWHSAAYRASASAFTSIAYGDGRLVGDRVRGAPLGEPRAELAVLGQALPQPVEPSVTVSPSAASASGLAPLSTLMPGMIPLPASTFGNGTPSLEDWRIVSSNRITPLMNSSTPSVVKRRSR